MYNMQVLYHLKMQTFMGLNEKPFPIDTRKLCVTDGNMSYTSKF